MPTLKIDYINPRQREFLKAKNKYVAFGGSRGGGKSWVARLAAVLYCEKYPGIKVMIIRKTYPELQENHIIPLTELLNCYAEDKSQRLATYNDGKKHIVFPNGSRILFRYLDNDKDAQRFQGSEVDILIVDEATHQSEEKFKKLTACVRGVNSFPKRIYCTTNPGNEGHAWVKRLFVDRQFKENENPDDYLFIRSSVFDNKPLLESSPEYVAQLEALPPKLRKAWLEGDWDIFEGAFFEDFRTTPDAMKCKEHGISPEEALREHRWTHVIPAFTPPATWNIVRSYDFGYSKPFSLAYYAIDFDGTIYRILEWYGCTGEPNEGLRLSPDEQFKRIAQLEQEHPWLKGKQIDGVADPAIWESSTGISVAETAANYGIYFQPGDHKRIAGWMQCHYRMQFDENGYARFYCFDTCKEFIRTIPLMLYDEHKPEDLDTALEDHCLVGDTQVLTEDGYKNISDLVGTQGKVMSHDGQYHNYRDVRLTRKQADIVCVELEDGTKIYCTDGHRFMLPSGEWCTAGNLSAGKEIKTYGSTSTEGRGYAIKVKSVTAAGKADVYNMEVDDTHNFVIQGGAIAHNCADEWRYMLMSRPIEPQPVKEKQPAVYDPLNQFTKRRYR